VDGYERQNIEGNAYGIRVEKEGEFGGEGAWRGVKTRHSYGHEVRTSHKGSKKNSVFSTVRVFKSFVTVYRKPHT
jgi:hypothetical protein